MEEKKHKHRKKSSAIASKKSETKPKQESSTFGLEEIGIPGTNYLNAALTNCEDPLKAIEEFQVYTCAFFPRQLGRRILCPSLQFKKKVFNYN